MKFGNIIYKTRNKRINLGDDIQLVSIENLYAQMGISYEEVVRINFQDLWSYNGENILLPISFPFLSYGGGNHILCFSNKITPIFLALCILTDTLDADDIAYLKRYAPIGCRDLHTLNTMRKYDIESYLFGCMTLTMPRTWQEDEQKTEIYGIDVSDKLINYMPSNIHQKCTFMSNAYNIDDIKTTPEDMAKSIYKTFINRAKLIITSRLHVALPCFAAGMPVIFAKDTYSWRFSGVNRIVPVYDEAEYSSINWEPTPINYEDIKEKMLNIVISRLQNDTKLYKRYIQEWNQLFLNSPIREGKIETIYHTENYLKNIYAESDEFLYIVWSITQTADLLINRISLKYPKAKLVAVVDKSKKIMFHGIQSTTKEIILQYKNALVLVCSDSAIPEAMDLFLSHNIRNYFLCCKNEMKV